MYLYLSFGNSIHLKKILSLSDTHVESLFIEAKKFYILDSHMESLFVQALTMELLFFFLQSSQDIYIQLLMPHMGYKTNEKTTYL